MRIPGVHYFSKFLKMEKDQLYNDSDRSIYSVVFEVTNSKYPVCRKNTNKTIKEYGTFFQFSYLNFSADSASFRMLLRQPADASCRTSSDDPMVSRRY